MKHFVPIYNVLGWSYIEYLRFSDDYRQRSGF